ncbi:hypothetical protein TCE0_015r01483 [Talaromyces pinophilus]|uniref:AAA+ ATPase domain-containing protein n=1 Tax=Talaromyces pinophilus TaxID=128442 RepID=A0A6V8GZG6_TALPI|nr:hypothetical protein TCE0_015r01483 [Talaromyces pinophilus]
MSDQSGSSNRAHRLDIEVLQEASSDEDNSEEVDDLRLSSTRTYGPMFARKRTINQYAARCPGVEPAVIYQATIVDAFTKGPWPPDRGVDGGMEVVTYQDDRPFQFATSAQNHTIQVDITQPDRSGKKYDNETLAAELEEDPITEWTGPVFEVNFIGRSLFSYRMSRNARNRKMHRIIPKTTEDLSLENISGASIVLKSPHLLHALEGLIDYYPSFQTLLKAGDKKDFKINEPFAVVMHHFQSIKAFVEKEYAGPHQDSRDFRRDELQKKHMRHLYEFAEPLYHENVVPCEQHLSEACPRIAFDMIWYLLKPGTDVYVQSAGITFVAVVVGIGKRMDGNDQADPSGADDRRTWWINIWHLNTDGATMRRTQKTCVINAYSGLRDVTELPVYPVSVWDAKDKGERREKILARSRVFFKALQKGNLLAYHDGPLRGTNSYYTGKVVVDHRRGAAEPDNEMLGSFNPVEDHYEPYKCYDEIYINDYHEFDSLPSPQSYTRYSSTKAKDYIRSTEVQAGSENSRRPLARQGRIYLDTQPNSFGGKDRQIVQGLTEHQLLLLYPETAVYGLKLKQWMMTTVDYIREIVPSVDTISNLVIGEEELRTIRALSNKQNSKSKQWAADFIEGKGTGQIILLHGPPGVGKTYTVETIAEWLHRPLLALTVADIGTVETLVEQHLFKWFNLAEAWNAVLLVDEADIFLERRQNRDLGRNGLVSAFLRRMEYFKGLLFLTTNRVGQIDDAFISRVHVAIGYDKINADTRKKIWNGFFQKLARERAGKIQIAPDAKKWVLATTGESQAQLNGRDIRNALQTAITLAEFESEEDPDFSSEMVIVVTKDHFQRVLEMSNKFHDYVTSIRREDERKRAHARGDRNDYDGDGVPSNQLSVLRRGIDPGQASSEHRAGYE